MTKQLLCKPGERAWNHRITPLSRFMSSKKPWVIASVACAATSVGFLATMTPFYRGFALTCAGIWAAVSISLAIGAIKTK